jgi:hypothetical protein
MRDRVAAEGHRIGQRNVIGFCNAEKSDPLARGSDFQLPTA